MSTRAERRALRGLDRTLHLARSHTLDLCYVLAPDFVLELEPQLADLYIRDLGLGGEHEHAHGLAVNLKYTLAECIDGIRQRLGPSRFHNLKLVRGLDRNLTYARNLERELGRAFTPAREAAAIRATYRCFIKRAIDHVIAIEHNVRVSLRRAQKAARKFIAAGEDALIPTGKRRPGRAGIERYSDPARVAVRVARLASALLPERDRDRYSEEYRAELVGLAVVGAGRWRQLCHAAWLVVGAGHLRTALTWAHRHRREVV